MTLDELLAWRRTHGQRVTLFLKQHRELAGAHYLTDAEQNAYVEFVLKPWAEPEILTSELQRAFPDVPWKIVGPEDWDSGVEPTS